MLGLTACARRAASLAAATAATLSLVGAAQASAATEVVRDADVVRLAHGTQPPAGEDWIVYHRGAGTAAFRTGPGSAPLGLGSLELSTPTGSNDKVYAFNYDHAGTSLSDVDALSYSTYRTTGNLQQVAALNVEVDVNGAAPNGSAILVFEPVYNTGQGAVVSGQWQSWDAYDGGDAVWWSPQAIPGVCAFDCYVSWADILAANPDAVISGGFGVNQGGGNPGLVTAVDALTIGTTAASTTYDFEPTVGKESCKGDGWKQYAPAFKNQGDCVSFAATQGGNG